MADVFPEETEVAIIGAGPVGLMLASMLGQHGIRTVIFERRLTPHTEPRAIAFDPETLRAFQAIGRIEALRPTLELDVPISYQDRRGRPLWRFAAAQPRYGFSSRGTFYQPEFEAAIVGGLAALPSVTVARGITVGDVADLGTHVSVCAVGEDRRVRRVRAAYVVACDGGQSRTRERLGIAFNGDTFPERWLVVDMREDDWADREIRFFCDPQRPAVTLPVSKGRRRWEFLMMPGDDPARFADHDNARALIAALRGPGAGEIERSLVYTFHARVAERFGVGRVFLAGDAAHVMPPFAGQGLNGGIRDAVNLAWKLAAVCRGHADATLLQSYDAERRPHITAMTKLAVRLGRAIMPTSLVGAAVRDVAMRGAAALPVLRARLARGDVIPSATIRSSRFVNGGAGDPVGRMIPQPTVATPAGRVLLDDLLGQGFALVGIGCRPRDVLSETDLALARQIDARLVSLTPDGDGIDEAGELACWAGITRGVLVVRPDRFLADVVRPNRNGENALDWMRRAYRPSEPGDVAARKTRRVATSPITGSLAA